MTNETTKPVVTQADRDAVSRYLAEQGWQVPPSDVRKGLPLVEAFAKHRLATQAVASQDLVPVACTDAHIGYVNKDAHGVVSFHMPAPTMSALPHGDTLLYPASAIEAAQIAARNDALEEAARVVELMGMAEEDMPQPVAEWIDAWGMAIETIRNLRTPSQHQESKPCPHPPEAVYLLPHGLEVKCGACGEVKPRYRSGRIK